MQTYLDIGGLLYSSTTQKAWNLADIIEVTKQELEFLCGAVHGMKDAPLTPFTADMSASGDDVAAGILRMLTVQPHLICDEGYLERTIRYTISCGVIDQWLQARSHGFPSKEGMKDVEPDMNGIKSITEREYRTIVPVPAT